MNSKLLQATKTTEKVVKEDKKTRKELFTKLKSFFFSLLMFLFGASCILNYYQVQMFQDLFFSPVK